MSAPAAGSESRRFRLSPLDSTGLMFGLGFAQLTLVAVGVVAGSILMVTYSVPLGVGVLAVGCGLGLFRIHGASLVELTPQGARYMRQRANGQVTWFSAIPLLGGDDRSAPAVLADQDVIVVDPGPLGLGQPGAEIAVSRDRKAGTYAATLRVAGRQFALIDQSEQDWLVTQWGTALQAFIAERTPVVSIRWSEWAGPAGLEEHRRWLKDHLDDNPLHDVRQAYEQLLNEAGSRSTHHEVLVTVTIHSGKVRMGPTPRRRPRESGHRAAAHRDETVRPTSPRSRTRCRSHRRCGRVMRVGRRRRCGCGDGCSHAPGGQGGGVVRSLSGR